MVAVPGCLCLRFGIIVKPLLVDRAPYLGSTLMVLKSKNGWCGMLSLGRRLPGMGEKRILPKALDQHLMR